MRHYKNKEADLSVLDERHDFLSSPEMDKLRRENLIYYAERTQSQRDAKIVEKNQARAHELIPENVFTPEYQAEIKHIYELIIQTLSYHKVGKERFTTTEGWKKIFEASFQNQEKIISFFFQAPFLTEKPTAKAFIKRMPQDVLTHDFQDRILNLLNSDQTDEKEAQNQSPIILNPIPSLQQTLFLVDSRKTVDLLDLFKDEGRGIYDPKTGAMVGYDHPLLFHKKLQDSFKETFFLPINLLEFGKSEVVTPEKIKVLYENLNEILSCFNHMDENTSH